MFESTRPSLLSRVRDASDRSAWREFDSTYGPLVLGYCRRLGLQIADAEDIRQVVMTSLYKVLPNFQFQPGLARFRTYLGRAVANAVSQHLRRRNALPHAFGSTDFACTANNASGAHDKYWHHEWMLHHYRIALRKLRSTCDARTLNIFDRLIAGESIRNVASLFGTTPSTIRKVKQRVKGRLQDIVAAQIRDEDGFDA